MWVLNTVAAGLARLDDADHPGVERDERGRPTGRVWRADDWLRDRLPATAPPPLDAVGADLTRFGITGITDATPDLAPDAVASIACQLADKLDVTLMGASGGTDLPAGISLGPWKLLLRDHDLPSLQELAATVTGLHGSGRAVAVHCVTSESLVLTLAALREAGVAPGDRIEHAHR